MNKEETRYLNHLKEMVRTEDSSEFEVLLERLWKKEYYSILPNDQNRAKDGIFLRDESSDLPDYKFGPCRILEMLIALSRKMEYQLDAGRFSETYVDLFWEMLRNLGVLKFDNFTALTDAQNYELDMILTNWLDRKYSANGLGGIFPIHGWRRNIHQPQNQVEIWYHMMLYLSKNYED
jgi:hypothetical protein